MGVEGTRTVPLKRLFYLVSNFQRRLSVDIPVDNYGQLSTGKKRNIIQILWKANGSSISTWCIRYLICLPDLDYTHQTDRSDWIALKPAGFTEALRAVVKEQAGQWEVTFNSKWGIVHSRTFP